MPTTIFIITLHITTLLGGDYYVLPAEAKYQRSFVSKPACIEFSRPLARAMKAKSMPPGITLKGVVCRLLPMETAR